MEGEEDGKGIDARSTLLHSTSLMYIKKKHRTDFKADTKNNMYGKVVLTTLATILALTSAQIPSLGWCPEYVPMANFDMNRVSRIVFIWKTSFGPFCFFLKSSYAYVDTVSIDFSRRI